MADLKNFPEKFLTAHSDDQHSSQHGWQAIKNPTAQQAAMEAFFFGYQAFTAKPDEMLARRGLSRVHHRILFFIAKYPGLSIKELLGYLGVSKQALNTPLRQLLEMNLVQSLAAEDDKRKRLLGFTSEGAKLELALRREQARLLQRAFSEVDEEAVQGWLKVNQALAGR
ncbi:MarR family transcriptional regulator [Pseudomonas sp. R-22-3w-18]|uniref:MarR family transcriptional regulator n=2 Tax=Pseudomonas xionganensis TaxID=2654845 RepID=A0A6I4KWQ5_9PSED|nr:MarR family transcriptional regulator [Pseudomonas xionganensis]